MDSRTLYRTSALLLVLSAVTVTAGRVLHPSTDAAGLTSPLWGPSHVLWLAGLLSGMAGVTGLYLWQRERLGLVGAAGAGAAWIGMGLLSGAMYFEAVIEPGLIAHRPDLVPSIVAGEGLGAFLPTFLVAVLLFGLGFLALGVAMLRSALLPRWAIVLVIVGSVIGGPQAFLPPVVAYASFLALGLGLVGLGHGLWTQVGGPASAQAPVGPGQLATK